MSARKKTGPLLISFLLHLLFLAYFLFFAFKQHRKLILSAQAKQRQEQQLEQRRKKQQKQIARQMQAALFPKKSADGTQVIFDDEKEVPKKIVTNVVEKIINKEIPQKIISKIKTPIPELKPKPEVNPIDLKKLALANLLSKKQIEKQVEQKEKKSQEKIPEKKSLLSLTKCFLDHEKGNSAMCRSGADRKPTFEELKYICYEKQVQDSIAATWKMMYAGAHVESRGETRFTFLVNEDGQAEQIMLYRSSGNNQFDSMVLESVRQTTFPPIPKHFGVTKYRPQGGVIVLR
ncbi:TonB family protein [Candidatus Dependentiae bacterium]|nr:TonB family protein [Candidatus Dependentiae bacterium]